MTSHLRPSFKEICRSVQSKCEGDLQDRIQLANSLAKHATCEVDRAVAYRVKDAALNHGICRGFFTPRSDEAGRIHLISVGRDRRRVHMPIHRLSRQSRHHVNIKALLGDSSRPSIQQESTT